MSDWTDIDSIDDDPWRYGPGAKAVEDLIAGYDTKMKLVRAQGANVISVRQVLYLTRETKQKAAALTDQQRGGFDMDQTTRKRLVDFVITLEQIERIDRETIEQSRVADNKIRDMWREANADLISGTLEQNRQIQQTYDDINQAYADYYSGRVRVLVLRT